MSERISVAPSEKQSPKSMDKYGAQIARITQKLIRRAQTLGPDNRIGKDGEYIAVTPAESSTGVRELRTDSEFHGAGHETRRVLVGEGDSIRVAHYNQEPDTGKATAENIFVDRGRLRSVGGASDSQVAATAAEILASIRGSIASAEKMKNAGQQQPPQAA